MTTTTEDDEELSKIDQDALEMALQQMLADPEWCESIEWKQARYGWWDAASFAATTISARLCG
jgi:hypothetical protein